MGGLNSELDNGEEYLKKKNRSDKASLQVRLSRFLYQQAGNVRVKHPQSSEHWKHKWRVIVIAEKSRADEDRRGRPAHTAQRTQSCTMQLPRKMSAQNMMASISRTLGNRHDGNPKNSNEVKLAGEESKDKLYEPKHRQKVVRVLTVVAYVVSVSLAAIILSLYYTFIWDPKDHALYSVRQTSLNSTAKVECFNVTIPVVAEIARTDGSSTTRVETKLPINDTESVVKFSSALEANEDVPIEMIAGPAGDADLASERASAVPAVVQPEPNYVEK